MWPEVRDQGSAGLRGLHPPSSPQFLVVAVHPDVPQLVAASLHSAPVTAPQSPCGYVSVSKLPFLIQKDFIYLFFRERGREGEREKHPCAINQLPLARPLLGTWPAAQACALTGN